jgi:hypothetical protein
MNKKQRKLQKKANRRKDIQRRKNNRRYLSPKGDGLPRFNPGMLTAIAAMAMAQREGE